MQTIAEKRKEKRWVVLVKPTAVMLNGSAVMPVVSETTWTIDSADKALAIGATTVVLSGNKTPYVRMNFPYKFYAPSGTDPLEVAEFTAATYDATANTTVLTLASALTHAYALNSRIVGGCFKATLAGAVSAGDTILHLSTNLGLTVGMYLVLSSGTPTAEVVTVKQINGTDAVTEEALYFDHADVTAVQEVDKTKYESSTTDLKYDINFDIVYGKMPNGQYAQLCGADKKPWIQVGETLSFDEAKDIVTEQANLYGLANVRVQRVVDLTTVLYPIS